MHKRTLLMALAALSLLLSACGEKQANTAQNTDNKTDAAVEENVETLTEETEADEEELDEEELDDEDDSPRLTIGQIAKIRSKWASNPLTGIAVNGKVDIERFAYVFCKEYSNYEANKAIYDYLSNPAKYDNEKAVFNIESQKKNGYLICRGLFQVSWDTSCCYWKRKNGHSLVAFWMEQGHENNPEHADELLVFYDYDPATDTMTPDPSFGEKIINIMSKFDDFSVRLPNEGKDIQLIGHTINYELDNCDNTYFYYRWNGTDFKLEQVDEEDF